MVIIYDVLSVTPQNRPDKIVKPQGREVDEKCLRLLGSWMCQLHVSFVITAQ